MSRPETKEGLLNAAEVSFDKLRQLIESMPEDVLATEFDFSNAPKKKEAHWRRDKNLRDVLIHLYEWHKLLLSWVEANMAGQRSDFLPAPYNWKTYGDMNVEFWKKHQVTQLDNAKNMLQESHKAVIALVQRFSDEELFVKRFFDWTGSTSLGSYCISALSSHYDWAIKKLRAHIKNSASL